MIGQTDEGVRLKPVDPLYRTGGKIPDTVVDGWDGEFLSVRSAAVRGRMHRHGGQPRQDAVAVKVGEDGQRLFIALADGVSSARFAHAGAQAATEYAVSYLAQSYTLDFTPKHAWDLVKGASWEITQRAERANAVPEDMSTTLICAAVTVTEEGMAGHLVSLGDSSAWLLGANDELLRLTEGKVSDGVDHGQVHPLPFLPDSIEALGFTASADEVLLLGSDGIGDPLGGGGGPLTRLFSEKLYQRRPGILDFVQLVNFTKAGFDDDRSLIAVWPARGTD